MTRKPNFWKCILGVAILSALFIGTWASSRAPRTRAAGKGQAIITMDAVTAVKNRAAALAALKSPNAPLPPAWDAVFEIDGNAADGSNADSIDDWNDFLPGNVPNTATSETHGGGSPSHADVWTFVTDPPISTDLIYTGGGSKDFSEISDWRQVARGTGPPKDDVEHAFAAKYGNVLVFGGDRPTNNGDANIGFWFFQNAVAPVTSGAAAGSFTGLHKNGDIFVLSAFSNGGVAGHVRVLVWVGEDPLNALSICTNTYQGTIDAKSDTTAFPQGSLCELPQAGGNAGTGITNAVTIPVSWQYTNKDTKINCTVAPCSIPSPDFFEGAIDLSSLPQVANECFASFLLETRSSDSVSAVLKDFALGGFEACNLDCSKVAAPTSVCEGNDVTYTYTAKIPTGSQPLNVTMRDDVGNDGLTGNDIYIVGKNGDGSCQLGAPGTSFSVAGGTTFSCTVTVSGLLAGTHTDKLYVTGTTLGGTTELDCESDVITVTINPNPKASASPVTAACETTGFTSHDFNVSGTFSGGTAAWSLTGTNTAGCSVFSSSTSSSPATAVIRCNAFGVATARLTTTSNTTPSCGTATSDVALKINPNATANAGSPQAACETTGFDHHDFTLSGSVTNGTASWAVLAPNNASCSVFSNGTTSSPTIRCNAFGSSTIRLTSTSNTDPACSNATSDVVVTVNQNPVITIADVACNASSGGTTLLLKATVSAGGGASPTFSWSGPSGGIISGGATDTITVGKPGTYTVTVTNGTTSCAANKSKNVGLCAADAGP